MNSKDKEDADEVELQRQMLIKCPKMTTAVNVQALQMLR